MGGSGVPASASHPAPVRTCAAQRRHYMPCPARVAFFFFADVVYMQAGSLKTHHKSLKQPLLSLQPSSNQL